MISKATTVSEYLDSLPPDRRAAISAIRDVIRRNLDRGYEEGMQYGMIGYYVPHSVYPDGYHCDPKQPLPFASIASQKNHLGVYMMCIYGHQEHETWFRKAWAATGKKLDMGKSCIRFKKLEDAALDVIGEAIRRVPVKEYIEYYESAIKTMGSKKGNGAGKATKTASAKTAASKAKVTKKAVAAKKATGGKKVTKKAGGRR